jgi:hypothetical protein
MERFNPISSNAWLPQSATECTASANTELEPVSQAAMPLATAMNALAPRAKRIVAVESVICFNVSTLGRLI